jgi:MoxR-like ATPase
VHLKFSRIQFTPDLMPADITGTQTLIRTPDGGTQLVFKPGPIFANIVLADEINRATPKTQSALLEVLEAMQEHAVTVAGERRALEEPFFVLATQNPLEMEGTYSLPEAQLDRFLLKIDVGYPTFEVLREIGELTTGNEMPTVKPVMTGPELVALQHLLRRVITAPHVTTYAARLSLATHPGSDLSPSSIKKYVQYGASPRAVQAMLLAGRAEALLSGRSWASTEDLRKVAHMVLRHRMILGFEAELEHVTPDMLVDHVLKAVPDNGHEN